MESTLSFPATPLAGAAHGPQTTNKPGAKSKLPIVLRQHFWHPIFDPTPKNQHRNVVCESCFAGCGEAMIIKTGTLPSFLIQWAQHGCRYLLRSNKQNTSIIKIPPSTKPARTLPRSSNRICPSTRKNQMTLLSLREHFQHFVRLHATCRVCYVRKGRNSSVPYPTALNGRPCPVHAVDNARARQSP